MGHVSSNTNPVLIHMQVQGASVVFLPGYFSILSIYDVHDDLYSYEILCFCVCKFLFEALDILFVIILYHFD